MANPSDDYYQLLGVQPTASDAEVRQAYKKAALRWHPDKNPQDRATAEMMFKKIAEAYKALGSAQKRKLYEETKGRQRHQSASQAERPEGHAGGTANSKTASSAKPESQGHPFAEAVPRGHRSDISRPNKRSDFDGMQEAYNLFEEVLGHDPFKDFDKLFEKAAQAAQSGSSKPRSDINFFGGSAAVIVTNSEKTVVQSSGSILPPQQQQQHQKQQQQQEQQLRPQLQQQRSYGRVRCVSRQGVAYRRSPNLTDRISDFAGPAYGDVIVVQDQKGQWFRSTAGWLPLAIDGTVVFEALGSQDFSVRCLSRQGVAYRNTPDIGDRNAGVAGPCHLDIVRIDEIYGNWVRCALGWLPLTVNGQPVFELLINGQSQAGYAPQAPPPSSVQAPQAALQQRIQSPILSWLNFPWLRSIQDSWTFFFARGVFSWSWAVMRYSPGACLGFAVASGVGCLAAWTATRVFLKGLLNTPPLVWLR